jgi:hypothetical protein
MIYIIKNIIILITIMVRNVIIYILKKNNVEKLLIKYYIEFYYRELRYHHWLDKFQLKYWMIFPKNLEFYFFL